MSMSQSYATGSSAMQLRDLLRKYEIGVANPNGKGEAALETFRQRDELEALVEKLQSDRVDIRAELTRLESADALLARSAKKFNRELRASGGFEAVRRAEQPAEERWWYYIDIAQAARDRKRLTTSLISAAAVIGVLVIAYVLFDRFAGPPKEFAEALDHITAADVYVMNGDLDAAIVEYEQAATLTPPEKRISPTPDYKGTPQTMAPVYANADPQVNLAALYTIKERIEEAKEMEAAAERIMGKREAVLEALGQAYYNMGEIDLASQTVEELLSINKDNARAYFIRGGIYELQGKRLEALADFTLCSELAQAQFNQQLYAIAKTRYVSLLQQVPELPTPTYEPEE